MYLITGRLWDIKVWISDLGTYGFTIWTCVVSHNWEIEWEFLLCFCFGRAQHSVTCGRSQPPKVLPTQCTFSGKSFMRSFNRIAVNAVHEHNDATWMTPFIVKGKRCTPPFLFSLNETSQIGVKTALIWDNFPLEEKGKRNRFWSISTALEDKYWKPFQNVGPE